MRVQIYNEQKMEDALEKARLSVSTAYHTEFFHRIEKLKDLSHYLEALDNSYKKSIKTSESKVQTNEQMLNQIKVLNAIYGGKVRYVKADERQSD